MPESFKERIELEYSGSSWTNRDLGIDVTSYDGIGCFSGQPIHNDKRRDLIAEQYFVGKYGRQRLEKVEVTDSKWDTGTESSYVKFGEKATIELTGLLYLKD